MAITKPAGAGRGALPAELTSFVGRRRELAETRRLLASSRLLTLTGVGGVGKTRLALRMAAEVRRTFPDGVWFVELAALHDPQLLAAHGGQHARAAPGLGRPGGRPRGSTWRHKQLLVVLDNCEHLTDACAVLASKLLAAAPGPAHPRDQPARARRGGRADPLGAAAVHATGLGSPGRRRHSLRVGAAVPGPRRGGGARVRDQRRATGRRWSRCAGRLDGIPLAIELAAVWLRILSPAQILDRLEDRFRLLTSGRPAATGPAAGAGRHRGLELRPLLAGRAADVGPAVGVLRRVRPRGRRGGLLRRRHRARRGAQPGREPGEQVDHRPHRRTEHTSRLVPHARDHQAVRRRAARRRRPGARVAGRGTATTTGRWPRSLRPRASARARPTGSSGSGASTTTSGAALEFCLAEPRRGRGRVRHRRADLELLVRRVPARGLSLPHPGARRWPPSRRATRAYGTVGRELSGHVRRATSSRTPRCWPSAHEIAARLDDDAAAGAHQGVPGTGHALPGRPHRARSTCWSRPAGSSGRSRDPLGEFDTLILLTAATFFLDDPRADEFSRQALALAEQHGAQSSTAYALWSVGIAKWRAGDFDEGDPVAAEVGPAVPADARPDRHQLRRPGAVLVCRVRRARRAGGAAARRVPGRLADQRGEGRRDDRLQRRSTSGPPTRCGRGLRRVRDDQRSSRRSRRVRRTRSTRPSRSRSGRTTTRMPRATASAGTRAGAAGGLTRREREIAGLLGRGPEQQGDRGPARHLPAHGRDARRPRPQQARA